MAVAVDFVRQSTAEESEIFIRLRSQQVGLSEFTE